MLELVLSKRHKGGNNLKVHNLQYLSNEMDFEIQLISITTVVNVLLGKMHI